MHSLVGDCGEKLGYRHHHIRRRLRVIRTYGQSERYRRRLGAPSFASPFPSTCSFYGTLICYPDLTPSCSCHQSTNPPWSNFDGGIDLALKGGGSVCC
ncbi:hypothetical protein MLD38_013008 [Melastoma candidum]|uniref:Uncharacterized protein n=1 Tax=Melastoma candidum TaxID=119954 RepID=A0ACB9R9B4_9MYRT|nr:hypothetical protein MLD38_013008 [Melastoma candidum]